MKVIAIAVLLFITFTKAYVLMADDCDCSWANPNTCKNTDGSVCFGVCCKKKCDCSWANPNTCKNDDGSICFKACCKKPGPTPPGPSKKNEPMPIKGDGSGGNLQPIGTNGVSIHGFGRVRSDKQNLLNGGISFTVDLSGVRTNVNSNLYFVIPGTLGNNGYYCDNGGSAPTCIELDIYESDGHKLIAATMHTKLGKGVGGCDTWGCRTLTQSGAINMGQPFDVDVSFSGSGDITVTLSQSGKRVTAFNNLSSKDGGAASAIAQGMQQHGAVVVSGMWTGWVPPNRSVKDQGALDASVMKITNLKQTGKPMGW